MPKRKLSLNGKKAIERIRLKVMRLRAFFAQNVPPKSDAAAKWFAYLIAFKDELGNIHNDVSLCATLLAVDYLDRNFKIGAFDAVAKAQGAPGLDIDVKTKHGEHIVAEIKTTHPYGENDLGAAQNKSFKKDAEKLRAADDKAQKFFFLTDAITFETMKSQKYRRMFKGIKIVQLPSGREIRA